MQTKDKNDRTSSRRKRRTIMYAALLVLIGVLLLIRDVTLKDMRQSGAIPEPVPEAFFEAKPPEAKSSPVVQRSAQETVLAAIRDLRDSQDPTTIFSYVDWPSVLNRLSQAQRTTFNVHSPAGLRQYYEEQLTNPNAYLIREMAKKISNFPPEKQKEMVAFIKQQREVKRPAPKNPVFSATLYELGKTVIHDSSATIQVKSLHEGKTKIEEVELIRRSGQWLLTCPYLIGDPINLCQ